jgi:hypothetical protein
MINNITDGIYTPFIYNPMFFLFLEIMTVIIEYIVIDSYTDKLDMMEKIKLVILMNVSSAIFGLIFLGIIGWL